uniref:Nucleolar protein 8 n=1 Tax=Colobus angolensis palliatus TaxID=336983 RepID=A0A2K5J9K5_COLAP
FFCDCEELQELLASVFTFLGLPGGRKVGWVGWRRRLLGRRRLKIGEDFTNTIPISSLTWELEGGNDPMSKKRRGEFSDFHGPPKKVIKVQKNESSIGSLAMSTRPRRVIERPPLTLQQAAEKRTCDSITPSRSSPVPVSDTQKLKNLPLKTSSLETAKKRNSISDDDIDSEDELRMMIAKEENLQRTTQSSINESENDPFEVVRDDFKSGIHKLHSLIGLGIKNNVSCHDSDDDIMRNDTEYDSGDTDEIIAMKKNVAKVKNSTEFSQMEKSTKKISLKNRENCELSDHCIKLQKRKSNVESALGHGLKSLNCKSPSNSGSSEDADSASELADSEGDEEYNAMMKNCLRVNLTLADLEQLAGSDLKVPNGDTESDGAETTTQCKFDRGSKSPKAPTCLRRGRQCIHPEKIMASLLEGEENTCGKQKPKENNLKPKFQAFKGVGCLYEKESMKKSLKDNVASSNINKDQNSMKHENPSIIPMEDGSPYVNGSSGKLTPCQHAKKANGPNYIQPQKRQTTFESQDRKAVSPSSSENRSTNPISRPLEGKKSLSLSAKTHNIGFDKDSCHSTTKTEASEEESSLTSLKKSPKVSSKDTGEIKTDFSLSVSNSSDLSAKGKHAEDNEKRLAALEARQKAKEAQKKLVHNALAKLDGHPEDKPTHIIFGSDSECETEETSTQEQSHPGEERVKESMGKTSGKLFDSSDDEESDSEDDSNRFKIKPQFEGRAGQKSHFGTDDRFRMDSRFLESNGEEEQEGKCFIVQSPDRSINTSTYSFAFHFKRFTSKGQHGPQLKKHLTCSSPRVQAFWNKAKRKKKREEAEKLPEVSKEMYYNIAMDLKEIFQTTKYTSEKEEDSPWNEDCGKEKPEEIQDPAALTSGAEQPSGFTFSFFDSDSKDIKEETYRVETVKPGKIVWQEDPRFQDSSSEEEDVTEETDHRKSTICFFAGIVHNLSQLYLIFYCCIGNHLSNNHLLTNTAIWSKLTTDC